MNHENVPQPGQRPERWGADVAPEPSVKGWLGRTPFLGAMFGVTQRDIDRAGERLRQAEPGIVPPGEEDLPPTHTRL